MSAPNLDEVVIMARKLLPEVVAANPQMPVDKAMMLTAQQAFDRIGKRTTPHAARFVVQEILMTRLLCGHLAWTPDFLGAIQTLVATPKTPKAKAKKGSRP